MTNPPWGRRRAESFAAAYDGTASKGDGDLDRETAELVNLAEGLCRAASHTPRPEFAQRLRSRLVAEAATMTPQHGGSIPTAAVHRAVPPRHRYVGRRRFGALAATFAVTGGSLGLVTQSAQALPGDMLYPVKRGVENVEISLKGDPPAAGSARLGLARERLEELRALTADGDIEGERAESAEGALEDFARQAKKGGDAMLDDYADHADPHTIDAVSSFTGSSGATLAELADQLPGSSGQAYAIAAETVAELNSRAAEACEGCSVPSLRDLPATLRSTANDLAESGGDASVQTRPDEQSSDSEDGRSGSGSSQAQAGGTSSGDRGDAAGEQTGANSGSGLPETPGPSDRPSDPTDEATDPATDAAEPVAQLFERITGRQPDGQAEEPAGEKQGEKPDAEATEDADRPEAPETVDEPDPSASPDEPEAELPEDGSSPGDD